MTHHPQGSLWNRWDLHFHTPASYDYQDRSITNQQIVDNLLKAEVRVVAITDHHTIDIPRIRELQRLGADKLTVLPGIELRGDHGGTPIHYICIFSEDADMDHVWTTFQGSLGLTATGIAEKGGDDKVYVPIEDASELTRKLGGIVTIHAGAKSNSIEGIKNKEQFQQRIKYDITVRYVDIFEIGQIKDVELHYNTIFPSIGLERPLIICSDNHKATDYSTKVNLWIRADPTFRGLLMMLREPRDRVYIGVRPPGLQRVERHPTKYIRSLTFSRSASAPQTEKWFDGKLLFNHGLVAIVGNKGSGKSALADTLGLLGSTRNGKSFSFLNPRRFIHPTSGFASHFRASLEWESGKIVARSLSDSVPEAEPVRVKYLPQDYVEAVCNELAGLGEEGFEKELKAVIFSHVPEAQTLGYPTLDDLMRFQTSEKQKRIDSLIKQLKEKSRLRAALEEKGDKNARRELERKLQQKQIELEAHAHIKPAPVSDPAATAAPQESDGQIIRDLAMVEAERQTQLAQIGVAEGDLKIAERRFALSSKLLERIANFEKDFAAFQESLKADCSLLELSEVDLVSLVVDKSKPNAIQSESARAAADLRVRLDPTVPTSLHAAHASAEAKLLAMQSQLDAPNRLYQAYLRSHSEWEDMRKAIEGTESDINSLNGLKAAIASLDELPTQLDEIRSDQVDLAMQIQQEKIAQIDVYRKYYGAVQSFIDSHILAKDKLKLEFRAELVEEEFASLLLGHLALNRRGSFMGIDEGRSRAEEFVGATNWDQPESLLKFLRDIDDSLHFDVREDIKIAVSLKSQMLKNKKPEDIYNMIYGLEYIRPRYVLRWENKDLTMLSPGERGTLLLAFYLLIDKSELPLVIDQPEGNLDNHTVAKVLVECIKEARLRRQVFIVTHNPNLAVVCDADQVVYAHLDISKNNAVTYTTGALENPVMNQFVTDVLEGTRWAFGVRGGKYEVCDGK